MQVEGAPFDRGGTNIILPVLEMLYCCPDWWLHVYLNHGEQRDAIQVNISDKSVPELPNSYALIHPVELGNTPVFVSRSIISQVRPSHSLVQGAKMKDELWKAHVNSVIHHDTLPENEVITWMVSVQLSAHE